MRVKILLFDTELGDNIHLELSTLEQWSEDF
jgi:hypothetical protein